MGRGLSRVTMLFLALAFMHGTAGAVWAADAAHGAAKEEGILDPRFDLGIWTIVVFVLLFLVLRKYAWGPMLEGLQKREQNIHNAIAEAHQTREEAHKLRDQFQAEIARAHEKVRDILDEARREAQQVKDDMLAKARAEIQGERDRLRREIDTARDQAIQELWNQTAQLAALVSTKAIRRQLTTDDHRRLVDEALTELRAAGDNRQRQVASVRQ